MQPRMIPAAVLVATAALSGPAFAQVSKDVNVVNTPTVTVGNSASNPVPVIDARPARVPVQGHLGCFLNGDLHNCSATNFTVPEGRRLVVEHVALRTTGIREGQYISVTLSATFDQAISNFPVAMTAVPETSGAGEKYVHFVASQPVKIFVGPGRPLVINAFGSEYFEGVQGSFSGHLEAAP